MQLAELWAMTNGLLDDVKPNAIGAFEQRLRAHAGAFTYLDPRLRASSGLDAELTIELRLKPRHLFRSNQRAICRASLPISLLNTFW